MSESGNVTEAASAACVSPATDVIFERFALQAERDPDALAVIDEHGTVTYGQLAAMARHVAAALPDDARFVGVVMDHGAEMIAAMLGILAAGAAFVPAEPDFPIRRIAFMFEESGVDAVVTQGVHAPTVGSGKDGRELVLVEPGSLRAAPAAEGAASPASAATPRSLAYVLYTSGTTGTPKGVAVENRNVCSYMRAFRAEFGIGPGDRMLQHSVCSFDIFIEEVFGALLHGATLVVPPRAICADAPRLAAFIEANGVTIVDGFPYLMSDLNALPQRPGCVRLYVSGGDVLHESQVSNLVGEAAVYNTYGPSETTCCVAYQRCRAGEAGPDGTYPVGTPISGTRIDVVDKRLRPVADGQPGELLITGPGVSRGYLGGASRHPEQANFVPTPRWVEAQLAGETAVRRAASVSYRSGDVGLRRADGTLAFLHRKDDQVMIGGKRVEAKEVENVLLQDRAIHQAVVVPGSDEAGSAYLTAYVVPQGERFSLSELEERLGQKLTSFMIPEFFVRMDAIPLNDHGKPAVDRLPVVLKDGAACVAVKEAV